MDWKKIKKAMSDAHWIPRWAVLRSIGNSRVVQLSTIFPFIGYLIIFNDELVKLLELSRLYITHGAEEHGFFATLFQLRLYFIFFGTFSLGIGSILFQIRCPYPVKKYPDGGEYAANERPTTSSSQVEILRSLIHDEIAFDGFDPTMEERRSKYLRIFYGQLSRNRPFSRIFVAVFFGIGLTLLAVPALLSVPRVAGSLLAKFGL